ncbi:MAG: AraC family transcriptional regulator [Pseudomonadota bacterium]|nr:MAG: AraC family transcriptional regulator [Pseudomonadota bacterium]
MAVALAAGLAAIAVAQAPAPGAADTPPTGKQQLLGLNRDLFMLEEELLFPANAQVTVFISTRLTDKFVLDQVRVRLDGSGIAEHLYTEREIASLRAGGIQRLHMGRLPAGQHQLTAFCALRGPGQQDFRHRNVFDISKSSAPKFVELQVTDNGFEIHTWE